MRAIYILFALAFTLQTQADYGMEEWVYIKDLPDDDFGLALDVEADNQGYVYVTGYCGPDSDYLDYFTLKLDDGGNEIWCVTYDGPAGEQDHPHDLEVDSDGFVYVTGRSVGAGTDMDFCTIKYDPDGNEEWIRRYDGPVNGKDYGREIEVTDAEEVIVGGYVESEGTDWDYFIIKYDGDGNIVWTAEYDGPAGGEDYIDGMAIDEYGNIYVTGPSDGIGTGYDYCTVKYSANGEEEWVARHDGPASGYTDFDRPTAGIALDADGNVFVSGGSVESFNINYCTVKYDNDGNEIWVDYHEGSRGSADGIAADENGNAYVTGQIYPGFSCTVKYDGDGNVVWAQEGDISGSIDIALDEYGAVYCCGDIAPPNDAAVVKYGCETGDTQWVVEYDGPESLWDYLWSITIDNQGGIFVCGTCDGYEHGRQYNVSRNDLRWDTSITALHNAKLSKREVYLIVGIPLVMKYSRTVSVELLRFSAVPRDERITLEWEVSATENENVEGFNLYRREVTGSAANRVAKADGPAETEGDGWTKINGALIAGANPYSYVDEGVEPDVTYEYKLEAIVNSVAKTLGTTTATTGAELPTTYALYQSRPNPTTGTATIAFDLPEEAPVTLIVYDISGRKVAALVNETLPAGEHAAEVSGLAPGVYVYKLDAADFTAARKMVVQ
ncbi:MAG: SBBP repeat-containing protein [Candidatus Coatesbacteria bacterium]|nr:MAG: SBBP repeat-containing protein [Candidatus Coatesbacteria bacterium]